MIVKRPLIERAQPSYLYGAGKGITDQDRNILSNQVLLLGFLQSASNLLNLGPKPNATRSKKKKARGSDDEDDSGTDNGEGMSQTASSRGTILITLRNVPPYTLWFVSGLISFLTTSPIIFVGIYLNWRNLHLHPSLQIYLGIRSIHNCDRLCFIERSGKVMSTE